jgi:prepilin-type N-terminal cleavage/methylation domain-containing protein
MDFVVQWTGELFGAKFGKQRSDQEFALKKCSTTVRVTGFTLVELAIVLVIVALLISGMLLPLSTQRDIQNSNETQKQFSEIKEALFGFAAANGRLPCPASASTTGVENPVGGGACANPLDGFLPGITLGIGPTDAQGYAVDAWGNRIRYAVTTWSTSAFTTTNGIKSTWASAPAPDLRVCNTSVGITGAGATAECATGTHLTSSAVAVIASTGKNGGAVPTGADELANSGANRTFVSHTQSPAGAPQGEFDDIVVWISPNILYNRMISAGKLP